MSAWKPLDQAPRAAKGEKPQPVVLFLPSAWRVTDKDGTPIVFAHCRVVGWWSESQQHWVAGLHPNMQEQKVYPSLWTECPDEPELS